jgi:hypothetical protein
MRKRSAFGSLRASERTSIPHSSLYAARMDADAFQHPALYARITTRACRVRPLPRASPCDPACRVSERIWSTLDHGMNRAVSRRGGRTCMQGSQSVVAAGDVARRSWRNSPPEQGCTAAGVASCMFCTRVDRTRGYCKQPLTMSRQSQLVSCIADKGNAAVPGALKKSFSRVAMCSAKPVKYC